MKCPRWVTDGSSWEDVIVLLQRLVRNHRVSEDEDEYDGHDVGPRDLPVATQADAQHEFYVQGEPVQAVDPADANHLDRCLKFTITDTS